MSNLSGKHIILGISGGIAAYKSVTLLRLLVKAGAEVQVVITPNGKEFITPVTLSSLSGKPVVSEFFTANTGEWHSHVDLGLWADAMIIAPATASTLAKMANGVADNMRTAAIFAGSSMRPRPTRSLASSPTSGSITVTPSACNVRRLRVVLGWAIMSRSIAGATNTGALAERYVVMSILSATPFAIFASVGTWSHGGA